MDYNYMPALHCSPQNLNTWLCKPENILASLLSVTFVLIVPLLRTSRQEIYNLLTPLSSGTSCCKLGKCMHNKKCIKKLPNLAWLCTAHRFVLPISWLVPYNALAFFLAFCLHDFSVKNRDQPYTKCTKNDAISN